MPLDVDELLDTRLYYSHIGLWPSIPTDAKPERWLANFLVPEQPYALALLDSFIYFNGKTTDTLFVSAFHNLSAAVTAEAVSYATAASDWVSFLNRVLITHPTGETPSVTDSGHLFDRKARQLLSIDESQILSPEDVLRVLAGGGPRPVVFVDDFAGSGDQFVKTWARTYRLNDGTPTSFEAMANTSMLDEVHYTPAVCTEFAAHKIAAAAPQVSLRPAHLLPTEYGAGHPSSLLFPPDLVADARTVILAASARAGVPPNKALGWKDLGLALGFEHATPDATLPIFWVDSPGWTPLVRRR